MKLSNICVKVPDIFCEKYGMYCVSGFSMDSAISKHTKKGLCILLKLFICHLELTLGEKETSGLKQTFLFHLSLDKFINFPFQIILNLQTSILDKHQKFLCHFMITRYQLK